MQAISDKELKRQFLGWQCRIRQIAMRQHGGRPSQGMTPSVLDRKGNLIMPGMTIVLVPKDPDKHTKFFEFQIQKSPDPKQSYEAALKLLEGEYFQKPGKFSDTLAAQFASGSTTAQALAETGECILEFEQFNQTWKMQCDVHLLAVDDDARLHVLAHNRVFNRNIPSDAVVLAFSPRWHSANTDQAI